MNDFFKDRRVLVVGGSSGIGAGIGAAFRDQGARVTVSGATAGEVARAQQAPELAGVAVLALDVRDDAAVLANIGGMDRLDVLVNCAGVIRRGEEHDPAVFAQVLDINLNGSMRTCAAARALLKASKGCIINTASMLSFFGGGLVPAYSASKGGVAQLTKSLAIAWAPDGIRVNAIAPGFIVTAQSARSRTDPVHVANVNARTPLGRWGEPQDIAGAALFLASDASAFITGTCMAVDGGYSVA